MARKKELCRAANGLFVRNLGWKRNAAGYAQQKFYLGRDEAAAKLASLRLEQLWRQIETKWERDHDDARYRKAASVKPNKAPIVVHSSKAALALDTDGKPTKFASTIGQLGEPSFSGLGQFTIGLDEVLAQTNADDRPVWDEVTLAIADAVRTGETVARIPVPSPFSAMLPESSLLGDWLSRLQADLPVIKIELLDDDRQKHTEQFAEREGHRLIDMGRKMIHRKVGGETLYAAFDEYQKWIGKKFVTTEKKMSSWGSTQVRQVIFIRRHLPNLALSDMSAHQIEELIDILRLRPNSEDGKQISPSWARNCIKQFRHFLRWLNKSPDFGWKRPADLEFGQLRIPLSPQEKSATIRSSQVETYSLAELRTCWEYAEPFQRLLMLLGLNCGFGRAEVASLEMAELLLRQRHPNENEVGCVSADDDGWILRARHKTGVYGEWKLWPETMAALEWWIQQRASIEVPLIVTTVLVTRKGQRYDTPTKGNHANYQIPNCWFRLTEQIKKDHPEFRRLSYNKLRKTAGNLIRKEADGEIAGVFLAHGTPVKSDDLLDIYTNRPFDKVFDALDRVGERLRALWDGVPNPFPEGRKLGGANISKGTIRRIQTMRQQGFKVGYVAEKLGISTGTVRRWGQRSKNEGHDVCTESAGDGPS